MAEMVSLKETPKEYKEDYPSEPKGDYYPVSMYLDERQIKALGIGDKKVGDTFAMTINVKVSSQSAGESSFSGSYNSMTLTVTEAAPVDGKPKGDIENAVYGKKEK